MLQHWIWLTTRRGLGPLAVAKLLRHFGSAEAVFQADEPQWQQAGIGQKECEALRDRDLADSLELVAQCLEKEIHVVTWADPLYPERLRNTDVPPAVLYYRGKFPKFDEEITIAVVGTRKSTPYGMTQAKQISRQICMRGGMIVSGMAYGIDSMALLGALDTDRPAVAVLGCGVDVIYPRRNRSLYEELIRRGCVISQFPPETAPIGKLFPIRNRVMSGLSLGVLVVEAPEKSGALITAQSALDQGRDVFAVPGNAGLASCAGSNGLIQQGAIVVTKGEDVIREYQARFPEKVKAGGKFYDPTQLGRPQMRYQTRPHAEQSYQVHTVATPSVPEQTKKCIDNPKHKDYIDVREVSELVSAEEKQVLQAIGQEPTAVDDVIERCKLPASRVLAAITMLEIRKYITRLPGRRVQLAGK